MLAARQARLAPPGLLAPLALQARTPQFPAPLAPLVQQAHLGLRDPLALQDLQGLKAILDQLAPPDLPDPPDLLARQGLLDRRAFKAQQARLAQLGRQEILVPLGQLARPGRQVPQAPLVILVQPGRPDLQGLLDQLVLLVIKAFKVSLVRLDLLGQLDLRGRQGQPDLPERKVRLAQLARRERLPTCSSIWRTLGPLAAIPVTATSFGTTQRRPARHPLMLAI